MEKLILYHGSPEIVKKPLYGKGKLYNDYGQGFYCTEHLELAREWACSINTDGFVNKYEIDITGLEILDLTSNEYTILHWLALLIEYRNFRISTPVMKKGAEWLKKHYLIDLSKYDIIIGYRADDSYFSFARAFLNNEISLSQLSYAMKLGDLGEQIVLKSSKVFERIKYLSYENVDNNIYYVRRKVRDEEARKAYFKEIEKSDLNGLYIRDIIKMEVLANDCRLR
ncbi:MAG: DUF3990 domain-containing protein [Bacilli bacterium]|nr:DUF3990 domain-containing protein [Bacilli bacterium]